MRGVASVSAGQAVRQREVSALLVHTEPLPVSSLGLELTGRPLEVNWALLLAGGPTHLLPAAALAFSVVSSRYSGARPCSMQPGNMQR